MGLAMNDLSFLDGPPPPRRPSKREQMKEAVASFFAAIDASGKQEGRLHMSRNTWSLVACGLAPYGGIGETDEWGAIWFDNRRLGLKLDESVTGVAFRPKVPAAPGG